MQPAPLGASTCANCGAVLEETPGGGLGCMSCLLRGGIGSEEEVTQDSNPKAFENGGRFGVYEFDRREDGSLYELGRGAMGVTYRATDTSLQRKVALKIIKADIAEQKRRRSRTLYARIPCSRSIATRKHRCHPPIRDEP